MSAAQGVVAASVYINIGRGCFHNSRRLRRHQNPESICSRYLWQNLIPYVLLLYVGKLLPPFFNCFSPHSRGISPQPYECLEDDLESLVQYRTGWYKDMKTPSNFGRTCEAQAYGNVHEQNQSLDLVPKIKPPPPPERKRPKPQFQGQCDIEDSSD